MPETAFRGDPYRILDVPRDASLDVIKRRWRELAREHHPDRAAGDGEAQERLTTRMARINAAYDVLRDPIKRARHDASPHARRVWEEDRESGNWPGHEHAGFEPPAGPPPPPPTRPVTRRFDTTAGFHRRNTTTMAGAPPLRGHPPMGRRSEEGIDLRASTPTGPVRKGGRRPDGPSPSLEQARATVLEFGRFHGRTLGEVADREPTYVDWIARTITRDRDLVVCARVVAADLDERGIERDVRPQRPGFGFRSQETRETAEASAG
jgi:curved DNA-binding protein CbpA